MYQLMILMVSLKEVAPAAAQLDFLKVLREAR